MKKLKNKLGMSMAEMLVVIGIIGVLSGIAFVGVARYQRSMGQLERDGIAKEIFVAAQNHLTMAYGSGYPGVTATETAFGKKEENSTTVLSEGEQAAADKDVYYFIVSGGSAFTSDKTKAIDLMLPFGSVDETVRTGGSYIIRYQPETGLVLDVFYCTLSGTPARFNHQLTESEYDDVIRRAGDNSESKAWRRDYNDAIIGWYGGVGAADLPTITLTAPEITVTNAERLYVTVTGMIRA